MHYAKVMVSYCRSDFLSSNLTYYLHTMQFHEAQSIECKPYFIFWVWLCMQLFAFRYSASCCLYFALIHPKDLDL
uniref:Uncharacterized protein n=1 Tax=Arundo donax TaxID=35708 RepID=A0A0A9AAA8_ARUDO